MKLLSTGKVKRIYQDPDSEDKVIIEFTDDITAGDGEKKDTFDDKGEVTRNTTSILFKFLSEIGIDTHFIQEIDDSKLRCHKVEIFPVEVVCRNIAAGSFCRRYGVDKGTEFEEPLIEFFLKDDDKGDPLMTEDVIVSLGLADNQEIGFMRSVSLSVNYYLCKLLEKADLRLVDFKLEFGKDTNGNILLADEISGDTIRVWDSDNESLDKDKFRDETGDVVKGYRRLLETLRGLKDYKIPVRNETITVIVMPKDGIKNPPGEVARNALKRLGFSQVEDVRAGKVYKIKIKCPLTSKILEELEAMNLKLLSNPIAEKHSVRL